MWAKMVEEIVLREWRNLAEVRDKANLRELRLIDEVRRLRKRLSLAHGPDCRCNDCVESRI